MEMAPDSLPLNITPILQVLPLRYVFHGLSHGERIEQGAEWVDQYFPLVIGQQPARVFCKAGPQAKYRISQPDFLRRAGGLKFGSEQHGQRGWVEKKKAPPEKSLA
jgi:hypothetical protein